MGTNFHNTPTTSTKWKVADVEAFLGSLDKGITYHKNIMVHCDGNVTYNSSTGQLAWSGTLRVTFNSEAGKAIANTVAAGNITLSDNEFAYLDLNETDGTALTMTKASVTTDSASNFLAVNRLVMGYRNPASDEYFPAYLPLTTSGGSDTTAIHKNAAAEISTVTEKTSPVSADLLLIEDSEDSNNKKRLQIGNLPGGTDGNAIHDNVASEISTVTEKSTPVSADLLLIEDSAASNAKKRLQVGNLPEKTTYASSAEINTGTEATKAVSPDSLAGSNFGQRGFSVPLVASDTDVATGDGTNGFCVPAALAGMNIVDCVASVHTAGTTGTTDIQIRRRRAGSDVDVLTTKLTVDSGEYSSTTAATPFAVNTSNDDLAEGDIIFGDIDAVSTTAPKGLFLTVMAQLP